MGSSERRVANYLGRYNIAYCYCFDVLENLGNSVWSGAIILVLVKQVLHRGEEWWGILNAGYFAGTIIGGLLVMSAGNWVNERKFLSISVSLISLSFLTLLFTFNTNPTLSVVFMTLMGPAYQLRDIAQRTLFQNSVPTSILPKVLASHGRVGVFSCIGSI